MARDCAEQRDYQEIAHPGTRRTVRSRLPRAADKEADRQSEQESDGGRVRGGQLGHRESDVIEMLREMLEGRREFTSPGGGGHLSAANRESSFASALLTPRLRWYRADVKWACAHFFVGVAKKVS